MSTELQSLQDLIGGLEAQRAVLGDAVVEAALQPLRDRLAALQAGPGDAAQQRRQVTVLFLDVVGSTMLAQRLDAEDMHAVLDGLLAQCTALVTSFGGKVLQYAGDSLLAVFGADAAHEDDAERAVHTALALLEAGRRTGDEVRTTHGHAGFDVRVGVHTGPVLLGGGVDAQHSIRGAAVHVAARLEQTAPAGGVRISHDTYRQVRGVFDVEAQPPLLVKGVDQPVTTYLVQRAKPRAFRVLTRGIEGIETRMIGRDAELERLQDAFLRVVRNGRLESRLVVGDAGVGKSRLLYEFENWAEARPEPFCIFLGRAHPQTQAQPYGLLRDVLTWRLQIADSDTMAVAKHKFESAVAPLFERTDGAELAIAQAHVLGHLIGLDFGDSRHIRGIRDDVQQIRRRGFHVAAELLRRFAAHHDAPVLLRLDDLHFADDASLDFVAHLAEVNHAAPMLLLGSARPTLFDRRPAQRVFGAAAQRVDLAPLDPATSRALADELLKLLDAIPPALRELVTGGAAGNPFYMEELVKMLIDEGAIRTGTDGWRVVPERLVTTRVPSTLTGVLQARLDGLPAPERLALQQAAAVGFVFWDEALGAVDPAAPAELPRLTTRGLALPHPDSALDDLREYAFKHQLLHQVTYDTVLKRVRRDYHARVAAWMARRSDVWPTPFLGLAAEHHERAGAAEAACDFYARAAEHARDRFAHEAALGFLTRALALLDAMPSESSSPSALLAPNAPDASRLRWRLLEVRERILDLQGRRAAQADDIDTLQRLAEVLDDAQLRGTAALRRATLFMRLGHYREQEQAAREAVAQARRAGDAPLRLRAELALALALNYVGDSDAAEALALSCIDEARRLGERGIESHFLNALSIVASMRDDTVGALQLTRAQLPLDQALGNPRDEAITHGNLGSLLLTLGAHAQAGDHLREGLRLARAVGDLEGTFVPLYNLSVLALRDGDAVSALAYAREACDVAASVANPPLEVLGTCAVANAELALGRHGAATSGFEQALSHAAALASDGLAAAASMQHEARAGMARVSLAQGDVARALAQAEALLPFVEDGDALQNAEMPFLIYLSCFQALERAGDARATRVLATAHAALQARAATISDPALHASFLEEVPEHRAIVVAWQAGQPAP